MKTQVSFKRAVAVAALFAQLTGSCTYYKLNPNTISPMEAIAAMEDPRNIRVLTQYGQRLDLTAAFIASDSVVGWTSMGRTALPLAVVSRVGVRKTSPGRTALLIAAAVATIGVGALAIYVSVIGD